MPVFVGFTTVRWLLAVLWPELFGYEAFFWVRYFYSISMDLGGGGDDGDVCRIVSVACGSAYSAIKQYHYFVETKTYKHTHTNRLLLR
jgi:hypothetical protein